MGIPTIKINHEFIKDGILYKTVQSEEEKKMTLDFFLDVMIKGNQSIN